MPTDRGESEPQTEHGGLETVGEANETAEDIMARHSVEHDLPGLVVCEEVTLDTDLSTAIRVYPPDEHADFDVPNQIS